MRKTLPPPKFTQRVDFADKPGQVGLTRAESQLLRKTVLENSSRRDLSDEQKNVLSKKLSGPKLTIKSIDVLDAVAGMPKTSLQSSLLRKLSLLAGTKPVTGVRLSKAFTADKNATLKQMNSGQVRMNFSPTVS